MKSTYTCRKCGKNETADKAPECCGQTMEELPVCTTAPSAEHARPFHDDEPCDDGRSGVR